MTINLFVGDNDFSLAEQAQIYHPAAFLIEFNNYKKFLKNNYVEDITVYTSFSDLPKITSTDSAFFEVLKKADNIFYCPPTKWSDHSDNFEWNNNQTITEYFLYHINLLKSNVKGLDISHYQNTEYLKLVDSRKTNDSQIWVAGCSIPHGIGVSDNEKFGALVSAKLGLDASYLTRGATSIEWAKDQILRSDLRSNDILIWGLTQEVRGPRAVNGIIQTEKNPDILLDENSLYRAVTSVYQVLNFCSKLSIKVILLPLICSERLQLLTQHLDGYCQIPYRTKFLDIGTDGMHPGPLQHQEWANICTNLLKE